MSALNGPDLSSQVCARPSSSRRVNAYGRPFHTPEYMVTKWHGLVSVRGYDRRYGIYNELVTRRASTVRVHFRLEDLRGEARPGNDNTTFSEEKIHSARYMLLRASLIQQTLHAVTVVSMVDGYDPRARIIPGLKFRSDVRTHAISEAVLTKMMMPPIQRQRTLHRWTDVLGFWSY